MGAVWRFCRGCGVSKPYAHFGDDDENGIRVPVCRSCEPDFWTERPYPQVRHRLST